MQLASFISDHRIFWQYFGGCKVEPALRVERRRVVARVLHKIVDHLECRSLKYLHIAFVVCIKKNSCLTGRVRGTSCAAPVTVTRSTAKYVDS